LERAGPQIGVDRRREAGGDFDPFTLHGAEALQCEGDRVGAWAEVDDLVLPLPVADDGSDLFDECRARGFDRDARHDGAGGIAYNSRDAPCALRARLRRRRAKNGNEHDDTRSREHLLPPSGRVRTASRIGRQRTSTGTMRRPRFFRWSYARVT